MFNLSSSSPLTRSGEGLGGLTMLPFVNGDR